MKHTLLLFSFVFCSLTLFAQREFNVDFNQGQTIYRSNSGEAIMVFPNPAGDYITLNDNDLVEQIVLINLVGKRVRTFKYRKGEAYNVEELPQGLYFIQLIADNGRILSSSRITKR